ncbi:MAG: hypothetical protein R3C69_04360 [Geminicoccaceae bacterium]
MTVGTDPAQAYRASVEASIANAFALAASRGCRRLALPFIAGGIFADRIGPPIDKAELAGPVVAACRTHRGPVEAVVVAYDDADRTLFAKPSPPDRPTLVQGSITSFADHQCDAIANPANMEGALRRRY